MTAEAEENWIAMGRTDEINIDQIKAVQVGPVRIILVDQKPVILLRTASVLTKGFL